MGSCLLCGKNLRNKIFSLDNMPQAVQNMPDIEEIKEDKGILLELYECDGCGLVQFDCNPVNYYKEVIRAGGCSQKMADLRRKQYEHLINKYDLAGKNILEVGCGAGEFLSILKEYPVIPHGIEASIKLVEKAKSSGLNVEHAFMDKDLNLNKKFSAFISLNYLEHQPSPNSMLQGIYNNLEEGGVGLITVPSFEYFMENASYYEFMRDHLSYFSEKTLSLLFERNGFDVLEISRFNEDTIEMIVKKRSIISLPDFNQERLELEHKINEYIKQLAGDEKKVAIWGASHQAFTLLATIDIKANIPIIVDSAEFKWNKYSPVSHICIVPPETLINIDIDIIIIMAPGYSDEIAENIKNKYSNIKNILSIKGKELLIMKEN